MFGDYCRNAGICDGAKTQLLAKAIDSQEAWPLSLHMTCTALDASPSQVLSATKELLKDIDYVNNGLSPFYSLEGLGKLSVKFSKYDLQSVIANISFQHGRYLKQKLQANDLLLEAEKKKTQNLLGKLSTKYEPGERVYVMQNTVYEVSNMFKIGRTKDLSKRLSTYNTSHVNGVSIVYDRLCCDSKLVEGMVHHILADRRCERNREYFECPLPMIKTIIDHAINSTDGYRSGLFSDPKTETIQGAAVSDSHSVQESPVPKNATHASYRRLSKDPSEVSNRVTSPYFEQYRYKEPAPSRTLSAGLQTGGLRR